MTAEILKFILEALKLAPRYLVALGAASAFLLFLPDKILSRIGAHKFAEDYRQWLGVVLVLTSCLFIVSVAIDIFNWYGKKRQVKLFRKYGMKRLNSLTEDEKQILRFYIAKQTKTNVLRHGDGVVHGLETAGIIYRAASHGSIIEGFPYNLCDFAWEYLQEHREVLNGSTPYYRTDKREKLF